MLHLIVPDSEPGNIFDSAVLKEIQTFRYRPRKIRDVGYETSAVGVKFTIELEFSLPQQSYTRIQFSWNSRAVSGKDEWVSFKTGDLVLSRWNLM